MSSTTKDEEEKKALIAQFRAKLLCKKTEQVDYWNSDTYLYKWLEDRQFSVDKACRALRKHLRWRLENKLDSILDEDMEDLHRNLVYFMDGVDKEGRSIVSVPCDQCDIKGALDSGNKDRIVRFLRQMVERQADRIRRACEKDPSAPSTFVAIADFSGVGSGDGEVTPQVVALLMSAAGSCEDNYPGVLDRIYCINASKTIKRVFTMARPALRNSTSRRIHVFSDKRHKWEPAILERISPEQISPRFGGTKEDDPSQELPGKLTELETNLSCLILNP